MTEINNRIEEKVKEAVARARAVAITTKRPLVDVLVEQICQLFSQPLDDKELREKIYTAIKHSYEAVGYGYVLNETKLADQILALLQPKIEEAVRAEHDTMVKRCVDEGNDAYKRGVTAEREGIIKWGVEPCPHWASYPDVKVIKRDCSQCWQALKGGE